MLLLGVAGSIFAANTNTKPIMHLKKLQEQNKNLEAGSTSIEPGKGYSSDSGLVGSANCFAFENERVSAKKTDLWLTEALSYEDFEKRLRVFVNVNVGIGLFSAGVTSDYLHDVKDTKLSYSFNYINGLYQTVDLNPSYTTEGKNLGLNQAGNNIYDNVHDRFGIICGDYMITSYDQGAILMYTLKIKFHNHSDKEKFDFSAYAGFGPISAATAIQTFAQKNNINADVSLKAYQVGGDAEKLGEILGKDPDTGKYYATQCSLQNMNACIDSINAVLDYASSQGRHATDGFTKQFDNKDNLIPFNVKLGDEGLFPIGNFGLSVDSLVTPEVEEARSSLAEEAKRNRYYKDNLNVIIAGYPVALDANYKKSLVNLYNTAVNNLTALEQGKICYTDIPNCVTKAKEIESNLKPITDEEIVNTLDHIRYSLFISDANQNLNAIRNNPATPKIYYSNGFDKNNYYSFGFNSYSSKMFIVNISNDLTNPNVKSFSTSFQFVGRDGKLYTNRGTLNGVFPTFSGETKTDGHKWWEQVIYKLKESSYYFTPLHQTHEAQTK